MCKHRTGKEYSVGERDIAQRDNGYRDHDKGVIRETKIGHEGEWGRALFAAYAYASSHHLFSSRT